MPTDYIFVYGSLRRKFKSPARTVLDDHAEFIGEATFQGKLYMIEWYPGVVESDDPDDIVYGELYKIFDTATVLSKLDQYEGCSPNDSKQHEFERKEKNIRLKSGKEVTAWMYIYVLSVSGKERIQSGDFVSCKN